MNILFVTTQVCVICSGAKRWAFVDNYTSRKYRETIYKTVILTALLFNTCTPFPQTALSWFAPFERDKEREKGREREKERWQEWEREAKGSLCPQKVTFWMQFAAYDFRIINYKERKRLVR